MDETNVTIETVKDLEERYPQLVAEIKDKVVEEIKNCPVKQLRENMPLLYERINAGITGKRKVDMSRPGFLLEEKDPIAEGTLRHFMRLKNVTGGIELPCVLPFDEVFTKAALENYILRAEGSGDIKRAEAAKEALTKCK